jgi:polyhydroxyalkanoate synthesis regulator phasin
VPTREAAVKDAVIGYLQVASGLTDVTRQKATATAKSILGDGGIASASDKVNVGQVQSLAEEIVAASKANRELLTSVIRAEVDRAVAALGLATRDDVAALRRQVERLQDQATGSTPKPAKKAAPRRATKSAAKTSARKSTKRKPATKKAAAPTAAAPTAAAPTAAAPTANAT